MTLALSYTNACFAFETNQSLIGSINKNDHLDLENERSVFRFVLSNINDKIIVYPSEGYYYFKFHHKGNLIKGNILFSEKERNRNSIFFTYYHSISGKEKTDNVYKEKSIKLTKNDKFNLKKITNYKFILKYKNYSKEVLIYKPKANPEFVKKIKKYGFELNFPLMDDSGVKFYLSFHPKTNKFYYLNDRSNDDEFYYGKERLLKFGSRTQFAYYLLNDDALILIGVKNKNVEKNNHYDGPFDQLPDDEIKKINFKELILKAYPEIGSVDNIENNGIYKDDKDSRVAIANYIEYENENDFSAISNCKSEDKMIIVCIQDFFEKTFKPR